MYDAIMKGGISSIADPSLRVAAFEALDSLREIVAPIVEERRLRPGSDMISDLATASYDGEPYPTDEIIATVAFLLTAGIETVERALTSLLRHLALDRDEWDQLSHGSTIRTTFSASRPSRCGSTRPCRARSGARRRRPSSMVSPFDPMTG